MRWLMTVAVAILATTGDARAAQPVYRVVENADVTVVAIDVKTKTLKVRDGNDSITHFVVTPKTWIIADEKEVTLAGLKVGQRLQVHSIPRTWEAVSIEVLPPKKVTGR
jgi:hypothetical protein